MSYTGITNKIIGITDNGLNTAAEMRDVLTEMSLEYFPYIDATKDTTTNYLMHSNVSNATISGATGKVLVTKDYLVDNLGGGSGFEALDEGNGTGWRLIGRNPAQFGNIGGEAIDASSYFGDATGSIGATGFASAAFGEDNLASGYSAIVAGYLNIASGDASTAFGSGVVIGGVGSFGAGIQSSTANNYSSVIGRGNATTNWYTHAHGTALNMNVTGGVAFGRGNTTTPSDGDLNPAATTPIFVVGNGTLVAGANVNPSVASDALMITMAGTVTAPSLTTALIDAEATGKVLVTREYLSGATSGTTDLSGQVPYTGATSNVDLGVYSITSNTINEINFLKISGNIGIGDEGTILNISGNTNIAIGSYALNSSNSYSSIGIGANTLYDNTGQEVVGIGTEACFNNTGDNVIGLGQEAGYGNTGGESIGIGAYSLRTNTGDRCVSIGTFALDDNRGDFSNAHGHYALNANEGLNSNGFGYFSLSENKANYSNGFGSGTLEYVASGSTNLTAIGHNASPGSSGVPLNFVNSTSIGANSLMTASNQVMLGDTATEEVKTSGTYVSGGYIVSALPTGVIGARAYVTDSTVAMSGNFGATVAGTGANVVPVFYDGTNWVIG